MRYNSFNIMFCLFWCVLWLTKRGTGQYVTDNTYGNAKYTENSNCIKYTLITWYECEMIILIVVFYRSFFVACGVRYDKKDCRCPILSSGNTLELTFHSIWDSYYEMFNTNEVYLLSTLNILITVFFCRWNIDNF